MDMKALCSRIPTQFVTVHRMDPSTHGGYLLVARTAFKGQGGARPGGNRFRLSGDFSVKMCARLRADPGALKRDATALSTIPSNLDFSETELLPGMASIESHGNHEHTLVVGHDFPAGAVIVLATQMDSASRSASVELQALLAGPQSAGNFLQGVASTIGPQLSAAVAPLTCVDVNIALYRSESEERDSIRKPCFLPWSWK